MNILLTNDDGYDSYGIKIIKPILEKYGKVVIAAPLGHMSAKSVSITIDRAIRVIKTEDDVFAIDGTPADCVSFALTALDTKFDLVISGCNNGFNIGYDTIYSGTVGAALQALVRRKPAIAISCDFNFDLVEEHLDEVLDYIFKNNLLSTEYLLNVNFPKGEVVKGIKLAPLYCCEHGDIYLKEGDNEYRAHRHFQEDFDDEPDSDCYLVNHGYVSITPLSKTNFHKSVLEEIKNK